MNEFKTFITCVLAVIAFGITIAASVGAIEYGIGAGNPSFYATCGVFNLLGWGGLVVWRAVKFFRGREEENPTSSTGGAGVSSPSKSNDKEAQVKDTNN